MGESCIWKKIDEVERTNGEEFHGERGDLICFSCSFYVVLLLVLFVIALRTKKITDLKARK